MRIGARAEVEGVVVDGTVADENFRWASGAQAVADVTLRAPVAPATIVGVMGGFLRPGNDAPPAPQLVLKSTSSVIGPGQPIECSADGAQTYAEGELAAVFGRSCYRVDPDTVWEHLAGFTVANDVTVLSHLREDGDPFRAKSQRGACPLGPWVIQTLSPELITEGIDITTSVNGKVQSTGSTRDFRFPAAVTLSRASWCTPLEPGDIVIFGTVAPVEVRPDDTVDVTIDRIGTPSNPVIAAR